MLKVLLVDDFDIVRIELKRMPVWGEKSGFQIVDEARNGEEALNKLQKQKFDLVITDIRMPIVDGIELLSEIVEGKLCSCVVLLSDFSEFSYARQGIILGAFDFLTKPAKVQDLETLLQRAGEHIEKLKLEADRIKKLEEVFEGKTEEYYDAEDVLKIAELVQSRQIEAIDKIKHIIERVGAQLDYDMLKIEGAMRKAVPAVISEILRENGWIEKFISLNGLKEIAYRSYNSVSDILEYITYNMLSVIDVFNNLQLGYKEKGIIWDVSNYIVRNIDNGLSLQTVAEDLYINKTYLSEVFKQKTGIPFIEYLTAVKMERAKQLISSGDIKPDQVADILGYKDLEYFRKNFKKYTGKSITEFKLSR